MHITFDDGRTKYKINIELEDNGVPDEKYLDVSITLDDQQTFKGILREV